MDRKADIKIIRMWGISLFAMGLTGVICSVCSIAGIVLPELVKFVIGGAAGLSLAVFTFASVRWIITVNRGRTAGKENITVSSS